VGFHKYWDSNVIIWVALACIFQDCLHLMMDRVIKNMTCVSDKMQLWWLIMFFVVNFSIIRYIAIVYIYLVPNNFRLFMYIYTGLFEMIVRVLTTATSFSRCNPMWFLSMGLRKDQVYVPPLPASIPELKVRIRTATETITADMLQTVWNELHYRVDVCRITKVAHIEHL